MNKWINDLIWAYKYKKACQWARLVVWLNLNILAHLAHLAQSYFSLIFSAINTYNCFWFDLINKKNSVTEDKSMVKSDQCLRLFSSRRQPPLLVYNQIQSNMWILFNSRGDKLSCVMLLQQLLHRCYVSSDAFEEGCKCVWDVDEMIFRPASTNKTHFSVHGYSTMGAKKTSSLMF